MYILFVFSSHHITTPSSVSESLPKQMPLLFLCLGFLYGSLHFISVASLSMGGGYLIEQGQLTSCFNIEEYNYLSPSNLHIDSDSECSSLLSSWVLRFHFVCMLDNIYLYLLNKCYFTGARGSLNAALICIYLMDTGTEQFFFLLSHLGGVFWEPALYFTGLWIVHWLCCLFSYCFETLFIF